MTEFITQFGGLMGVVAAVIFGGFGVYGLFNKNSRQLKREENETAKDLIGLLSNKVTILEGKVEELEAKVDELTSENKTLRDVLQGRDGETKQFYKDSYAMWEIMKHNDKTSEENGKLLSKMVTLLETVIKVQK